MLRLNRRARVKSLARIFVATILLSGVMTGALPVVTEASGEMCALSCCAGRAPHAAGSCMNGSCKAFLRKSKRAAVKPEVHDRLCGLVYAMRSTVSVPKALRTAKNTGHGHKAAEKQAQLSSDTIAKPCDPGCGAGAASGFSGSSRERDSAALSHSLKSRPPTLTKRLDSKFALIKTLNALCRQSAPRAPPFFS